MMLSPALLLAALAIPGPLEEAELPKVLFFANPMQSDNDVIRRPRPGVLSVAERHFAELSRGVFDVRITQDGAEVTREKSSLATRRSSSLPPSTRPAWTWTDSSPGSATAG